MLRSLKFSFISQSMQALQSLPSHIVLLMHGWQNSVVNCAACIQILGLGPAESWKGVLGNSMQITIPAL